MVLAWSRKSYLGLAERVSCVFLVLGWTAQGQSKMSSLCF